MSRSHAAWAFVQRWRWYFCILPGVTLLWMLYSLSSSSRPQVIPRPHNLAADKPVESEPQEPQDLSAANSTLGFESILALSPFPSWRTNGLHAAANVTGLNIEIPSQPPLHPELVDAFAGLGPEDVRHPNHGSAVAWLAHLNLIRHVVQSDFETALIMEDDVDWDMSIKAEMLAVAEAVRKLTKMGEDGGPYGTEWDVLWVGLCAETWDQNFDTVYVDDSTVCPPDRYVGLAKGPVDRLPRWQRAVFYSGAPICTFAYALSREGAKKVLLDVGAAKDEAFDISLMNGCRERNLTCISVLPELFRHYIPSDNIGSTSLVNPGEGDSDIVTTEVEMGHTENIMDSARCHAMWGQPCL